MNNFKKYAMRLLSLIPVSLIVGIISIRKWFDTCYYWVKYGGEVIVYDARSKQKISDLLLEKNKGQITRQMLIDKGFTPDTEKRTVWHYKGYRCSWSITSQMVNFPNLILDIKYEVELNSMMNVIDSLHDNGINENPWEIIE